MKIITRTTALVACLALSGALLAACGDDEDENATAGDFELVAEAPEGYDDVSGEAELARNDSGTEVEISFSGLKPDTEYIAHVHAASCDQADPGGPHFKFDLNGGDTPPNEIHLPFTTDADGNGEATASNDQVVPEDEGPAIVVHEAGDGHSDKAEGHSDKAEGHSGDGHAGHSHEPKIACAPLS